MSALGYIQTGSVAMTKRKLGPSLLDGLRRLNDLLFLSEESNRGRNINSAQEELRTIGFSRFQLDRNESTHIAAYLDPDEHIRAGMRGHIYGVGGVLMVATDSRVLYLHDTPLFSNFEEFTYDTICSVSINRAGRLHSITISTNFNSYQIDRINPRQAEQFLRYVESQIYSPSMQNAIDIGREVLI